MILFNNKLTLLAITAAVIGGGYYACFRPKIDFNSQVKPILNKKCMACHGGVKQAGGFSLLFEEEALANTKSGKPAIVPGDAAHSEMIVRLTSTDPDKQMPKKGESLSKEEIEILTKWIDQGANWGRHWAYKAVEKPSVPNKNWWNVFAEKWANNDIDNFVEQKHKEQKLTHAPQADKATLLRRVTLDITGLSPTDEQYLAFENDKSADAYQKVVDSLLKSTTYGEKWASMWLDLARYADSRGYEKDDYRNIWRYRDWVIRAFNDNMPYDQFITEQLAGDLLPKPTENQLIATAFHRNTTNNDEGGTDDEEFRTSAVLDRVSTTWVAFGGTTFACTQCHSHPYDPFKHDEFYKYMAFFNNTRDEDVGSESAYLRFFEEKDQKKLTELSHWLKTNVSEIKSRKTVHFLRTVEPRIYAHNFDKFVGGTAEPSSYAGMENGGSFRLKSAPLVGKRKMLLSYSTFERGGSIDIKLDSLKGQTLAVVQLDTSRSRTYWNDLTLMKWVDLPQFKNRRDLYFVFKNSNLKPEQDVCMLDWVLFMQDDLAGKGKAGYDQQRKNFEDLLWAKTENMPILQENPKDLYRTTRVFERGSFLSPTKAVQADVPKYLHSFPKNAPKNRLGLSQWTASKDNPLTARTLVNRVWEQFFGTGLVETLEDMGTQGFSPTHPELLDYLSYKLMNDWHWQIKPLIKEIAMSATYRQTSHITNPDLDPNNRYLARGPRVRLSGEQVRDEALVVSGLLSKKMYGKPVMPYQPKGVWQVVYSGQKWLISDGEDAYRRAIYTFVRRSSPYPSMLTFDGSTRDVCLARRIRTNTPLQALVTLNDSAFVEMAHKLAIRLQKEGKHTAEIQIERGYWLMLGKVIERNKLLVLSNLYKESLAEFRKYPKKQAAWLPNAKPETAALAVVTNMMLNMDEFLTKE